MPDYKITQAQLQKITELLEDAPWKYAHPVLEIIKEIVVTKQAEDKAAELADEVS